MKASEWFSGAIGSIFDLVFGIGGDGRKNSFSEQYDSEDGVTPDIYINGNLHPANSDNNAIIQSGAAPVVDQTMANGLALQEGFAAANDNPVVYEMRAPEYPPMPSPVAHDYTPAAPVYAPRPSYDALSQKMMFEQAMQVQDQGISHTQ